VISREAFEIVFEELRCVLRAFRADGQNPGDQIRIYLFVDSGNDHVFRMGQYLDDVSISPQHEYLKFSDLVIVFAEGVEKDFDASCQAALTMLNLLRVVTGCEMYHA